MILENGLQEGKALKQGKDETAMEIRCTLLLHHTQEIRNNGARRPQAYLVLPRVSQVLTSHKAQRQ